MFLHTVWSAHRAESDTRSDLNRCIRAPKGSFILYSYTAGRYTPNMAKHINRMPTIPGTGWFIQKSDNACRLQAAMCSGRDDTDASISIPAAARTKQNTDGAASVSQAEA